MENSKSYSDKSSISQLPVPVPSHPFRPATRFGGAWDGADTTYRRTGRRARRKAGGVGRYGDLGEPNGTPDERGNGERKSRDDFHLISRYYPIGGGDYGCPALSPRGGGFASSSSFSFSSFLVLALNCYLPPPLRAEKWRPLLPIPECSGRHCRKRVFCRSG